MRDPSTISNGNGPDNLDDLYLDLGFMERKDPRKLGREAGGKEVEVGSTMGTRRRHCSYDCTEQTCT